MVNQRQIGLTEILVLVLALLWGVYAFWIHPQRAEIRLSQLKDALPVLTEADRRLVEKNKRKTRPTITPYGVYSGETEYNGRKVRFKYSFLTGQTIEKEVLFQDRYRLAGTAKVIFVGSTIQFDERTGDRILFPVEGEVLRVLSENEIIIKDALSQVTLKSNY